MSRVSTFERIHTTHHRASKYTYVQMGIFREMGILKAGPPWINPGYRKRRDILKFLEGIRE